MGHRTTTTTTTGLETHSHKIQTEAQRFNSLISCVLCALCVQSLRVVVDPLIVLSYDARTYLQLQHTFPLPTKTHAPHTTANLIDPPNR